METLKTLFLAIITVVLFGCASQTTKKEIEMIILDKEVKHGSLVTVKFINNTGHNIYLPIDHSELAEKADNLVSKNERAFFFAKRNIERLKDNEWIPVIINDCYETSFLPVTDEWKKTLRNKTVKELMLLKKGESKTVKFSFHLYQEMAKYCNYQFSDYKAFKNNEYVFYLSYDLKVDYSEYFLRKSVRDSLKKLDFKIYNGFLQSNKIPLKVD